MLFKHMDTIATRLEGEMEIEHHPFTDVQVKKP